MSTLLVPRMKPSIGAPLNRGLGRLSRPTLWYPMREGGGTKLFDASGRGNHGTFGAASAAPTWVTGRRGKCVNFDGTDDLVTVGRPAISGFPYTLSLWARTTITDGGIHDVAAIYNSGGFRVYSGFEDRDTDMSFRTANGDTGENRFANHPLSRGSWHMYTLIARAASQDEYIDGALVGTTVLTVTYSQPDATELGHNSGLGLGYFGGQLDDFRLYPFALTASEVQTLYRDPWRQFGTFVDREVYAPASAPPPAKSGRSMMMAAGS